MFCVIGATYEFQWEFIGYEQYSSEVLALAACLMRWYRQARAIRDVNWIESGGYESMRMHLSDFVWRLRFPFARSMEILVLGPTEMQVLSAVARHGQYIWFLDTVRWRIDTEL
jgi:hypothetical protein